MIKGILTLIMVFGIVPKWPEVSRIQMKHQPLKPNQVSWTSLIVESEIMNPSSNTRILNGISAGNAKQVHPKANKVLRDVMKEMVNLSKEDTKCQFSPTFCEKFFLCADPKSSKVQWCTLFLHFWDLCSKKLLIKCWWNRPQVSGSSRPTCRRRKTHSIAQSYEPVIQCSAQLNFSGSEIVFAKFWVVLKIHLAANLTL